MQIKAEKVKKEVAKLCKKANYELNEDVIAAYEEGYQREEDPVAQEIFTQLLENAKLAKEKQVPVCQDTGMVVVFAELGREVKIKGMSLEEAINAGVRQGYQEGHLRKSIVKDPLFARENTEDNTPAVVHTELVPGNQLKLTVAPKGFGSENMSQMKMLTPNAGPAGVKEFVRETVKEAGPNPCPPIVVGVGIGGTVEKAALLAKKSLIRPLGKHNSDSRYRQLEADLLSEINQLDIGPQGLGGMMTALAVNIESYPTHIAGLPVVVNINCHISRHCEVTLKAEGADQNG